MSHQSQGPLTLTIQQGPQVGHVFSLDKQIISLGRALDNDIVVEDGEISRHHARLTLQGENWILEDLGSRNGTLVNGQRVAGPVVLTPGSRIALGSNVVFALTEGTPSAALPHARQTTQGVGSSVSASASSARITRGKSSATILVLGGIMGIAFLLVIAAVLAYVYVKGSPQALLARLLPRSQLETTSQQEPTDQAQSLAGPAIAFLEPRPGTELEQGGSVLVFATARDPERVSLMELYVDDDLVVQQGSPDEDGVTPLSLIHRLAAIEPGTHALTVRAYNRRGGTGTSPVIYVRVFDNEAEAAQYVVQQDDTLAALARALDTTEEAIQQVNPGLGSSVSPNQVITVPAPLQPYPPLHLSISAGPGEEGVPEDEPHPGFFGDGLPDNVPQDGFSGGQASQDKSHLPDSAGGAVLPAQPEAKPLDPPHPDLPTPSSQGIGALLPSGRMGKVPGLIPMAALQDPGDSQGPAIGVIVDSVSGAMQSLPHSSQAGGMSALAAPFQKSLPRPELLEAKAEDCTVTLKWNQQKTDATHFAIYRMAVPADPDFPADPIKKLDVSSDTEYLDKVRGAGRYRYMVRAQIEDRGKVKAWMDSNFKTVSVPVAAACIPDLKYKRVYFNVFTLYAPDKKGYGRRGDGHVRISIGGTEFVRVPPFPLSPRLGGWTYDVNKTVSLPAPPSLYSGHVDAMLDYDVTISARVDGKGWNDSAFSRVTPLSALLGKPPRMVVLGPAPKWSADATDAENDLLRLSYDIWVDDVMWTGQQSDARTDRIKAPYDLRLLTTPTRALDWKWQGDNEAEELSGYIVYRFYSCPGQDSQLAAPQVVSKERKGLDIPARTEYPGCAVRYQVSGYGPRGESALSNPVDVEPTLGTARLSVTFEELEIMHPSRDAFAESFVLFANQYKLQGGGSLKRGKNELEKLLLGGKTSNNSLLVDLIQDETLQVGFVFGGRTPYSLPLKPPKGTTWSQFGSATHKISFSYADGINGQVRIVIDGKGPTPSGPSMRSADISVQGLDVCGEDRSAICVRLKNNGPDPVSTAQVRLTWFWAEEIEKILREDGTYSQPGKTQPDLDFAWISIPAGGMQSVRIIDVKDQRHPIPTRARYLFVSYNPVSGSGLNDPNIGNDSLEPVFVWDSWFAR